MAEVGAASAPTGSGPDAARALPPNPAGDAPFPFPMGASVPRDFSTIAPHLPDFVNDRCVGCMACVTVCPDAALFAIALPASDIEGRIDAFADEADRPALTAETARARFASTARFADQPARHGEMAAAFGLFVDPARCQGCGECVEICAALGHGALVRIDKVADEGTGESTLERHQRDLAFLRTLPPTPAAYRNAHILADLMLGDPTPGPVAGSQSCAGCGAATAAGRTPWTWSPRMPAACSWADPREPTAPRCASAAFHPIAWRPRQRRCASATTVAVGRPEACGSSAGMGTSHRASSSHGSGRWAPRSWSSSRRVRHRIARHRRSRSWPG